MDKERRENAEKVVANCTDIKSLIGSYNLHKHCADDYKNPDSFWHKNENYTKERIAEMIEWHEQCLALTTEKLEKNELYVSLPSFFDGSVIEHTTAPGLKIKKNLDKTFEVVEDPYNMEKDITNNSEINLLVRDDVFAQELYAALCNVSWYKNGVEWGCSWRYAGGLVADLRNAQKAQDVEDYMDFYCSGIGNGNTVGEGHVTDRVREALAKLSWIPSEDDIKNNTGSL